MDAQPIPQFGDFYGTVSTAQIKSVLTSPVQSENVWLGMLVLRSGRAWLL